MIPFCVFVVFTCVLIIMKMYYYDVEKYEPVKKKRRSNKIKCKRSYHKVKCHKNNYYK